MMVSHYIDMIGVKVGRSSQQVWVHMQLPDFEIPNITRIIYAREINMTSSESRLCKIAPLADTRYMYVGQL